MKRKLPPFPALRAFEATARLKSFRNAADELCVTPSAISYQVRVLEDFLGQAMFLRHAREIQLTEDGRLYLEKIGPLLDDLDTSTRLIAGERCVGPLRIKSTEGFCKRWLMPRLPRVLALYPELDVPVCPYRARFRARNWRIVNSQ